MGAAQQKRVRPNEKRVRIFLYVDPEDFAHFEEVRTRGRLPISPAALGREIFRLGLETWEKGKKK